MKMSILVHITHKGKKFIAQTCWLTDLCGPNLVATAESRDEVISKMYQAISEFIESFGRQYIKHWSASKEGVNCPQAYIVLPADLWYCKNTKESCPLQAWIDLTNPEKFFEKCLLSDEKQKEGIQRAITEGKYNGFHHVPGRYRCCLCNEPRVYFNYHYPWELTLLSYHCDIESIWNKRAKELVFKNFPRAARYAALCSNCFLRVSEFLPEIDVSEYEIITYNYKRIGEISP